MNTKETLEQLKQAVVKGNINTAEIFREALASDISSEEIMSEALVPALREVGVLMQDEEYGFPEILGSMKALDPVLQSLQEEFKNVPMEEEPVVWQGDGELFILGEYLVDFVAKAESLKGKNLLMLIDECSEGLRAQVGLPCKKQADSTKKG